MAEQDTKSETPRASKPGPIPTRPESAASGLKVGEVVTIRAKVVDVTPGTGLNCVLQVLPQDKDGKPVEEAHSPRFAASSAWCG